MLQQIDGMAERRVARQCLPGGVGNDRQSTQADGKAEFAEGEAVRDRTVQLPAGKERRQTARASRQQILEQTQIARLRQAAELGKAWPASNSSPPSSNGSLVVQLRSIQRASSESAAASS